jgi:hypothetical protein
VGHEPSLDQSSLDAAADLHADKTNLVLPSLGKEMIEHQVNMMPA